MHVAQRGNMAGKIAMKIPRVPFYFMRHGETAWNAEGRIMGQMDIPLNVAGIQQAYAAAENMAHLKISKIISSPLQRAQQTAVIIGTKLTIDVILIDELKECHAGILQGQFTSNEELFQKLIQRWMLYEDIEEAEPWSDFVARVIKGLHVALAHSSDDKPVLIVGHGRVYHAIQKILNITTHKDIGNCCPVLYKPLDHDEIWDVH